MHTLVYVFIHMFLDKHYICMFMHTHITYMHAYIHVYVSIQAHITDINMYAYICMYVFTYMQIHTHVCMHACM